MLKKSSPTGSAQGTSSVQRRSTPWHAVSVVTGSWACEAARGMTAIRYLSREAPRLPLPHCSASESCSCAYKHHADRRGAPRRQDERRGLRRTGHMANDRRVVRGRREDD